MSEDYIELEDAKVMIITALTKYDEMLGARAADILYNEKRLKIVKNPEVKTGMMRCRPAGVSLEYLKEQGLYEDDFKERFSAFPEHDNLGEFSIIDYEYDGSPDAVMYLAHELGHAIADDLQIEAGRSYSDFTLWQAEEQAYFVQSIYSNIAEVNSAESLYVDDIRKGALKERWDRAVQYGNADQLVEQGMALNPEERRALVVRVLGGVNDEDYSFKKDISSFDPRHEKFDFTS